MRTRHAAIWVALAACVNACETCPYRAINKHDSEIRTVGCCDAVIGIDDFDVPFDDSDVDVLVSDLPGQPAKVEAWLTRATCDRLFDTGSNVPRCEILIGPVAGGTFSDRKKVPMGTLRIWVRQQTPVQAEVSYYVGATVWRHQCNVAPG